MEYRPFGRTEQVSAIGFGCWEVGGGYGHVAEAEFARAVGRALDLDINRFDTAEGYGMGASERALGRLREDAIVVTKFGANYQDMPNPRDSSRERVLASIDKSLKNLGTDWIDVYLVHWPDRTTPFEETMQALEDVVRDGKARFVGVSDCKYEEIEACRRIRPVDVAQCDWNMFDRRMQREVFPYCEEHGIGVMAYGSLAFGLLTGTPQRVEGDRRTLRPEPSAARAPLGNLAFGGEHVTRRMPRRRRGGGQHRREGLVDR